VNTAAAHRLYIHLAWKTLARVGVLEPKRRAAIETHLLASCRWFGTEPIEVCALSDRVHLLVRLPAVLSVHELDRRVRLDVETFLADSGRVVRWAPGYAAVTVTPAEVRRVRRRIAALGWTGGSSEGSGRAMWTDASGPLDGMREERRRGTGGAGRRPHKPWSRLD